MQHDLRLIRDLQVVDDRVRELTQEIERLPQHVAEIEQKLDSHKKQLEADQSALAENRKAHRQFEQQISTFREKISKLNGQVNEAKTNEQYRAFQHEIGFAEAEIGKIEDRILDLMVEAETLGNNVKGAEVALKEESREVGKEVAVTKERVAKDEAELKAATARRDEMAAGLPPALLRTYEGVRRARHGVAVTYVVDDRCNACNVMFRPHFLQMLHRNDQVMTCESCSRIILHGVDDSPPLEDPAGDSGVA
jgi:predicted  nucleic acid-binding Zn-ribbon protein